MQSCRRDALLIIRRPYAPTEGLRVSEDLLERLAKEETAENILNINEQLYHEWMEENEDREPEERETEPPTPLEYWDLLKPTSQWLTMLQRLRCLSAEFTVNIKLTFNKLTIWQQPWGTYPKANDEEFVIEAIEFNIQSRLQNQGPYTIVCRLANIKSSNVKDKREILTLDTFSMLEWKQKTYDIIQTHWKEYLKPLVIQLAVNAESIKPPLLAK